MQKFIRSFIFSAIVLFSLALFPFSSKTVSAAPASKVTSSTRWLLIGDSYSVTPKDDISKNWMAQFQRLMDLPDKKVCCVRMDGYGYARKNKQFINGVSKLKSSSCLKKIIIIGGINNDKECSEKQIRNAMKALDKKLRTMYPKAKIFIAIPNWANSSDKNRQKRITTRTPWYKSQATALGWKFLSRTSNCLRDETDWWLSDGHHPNTKGGRIVGEALYYAFRAYNYHYTVRFLSKKIDHFTLNNKYHYGYKYILPYKDYTKQGYTLTAWKGSDGKMYTPGQQISNLTKYNNKIITMTAIWEKEPTA